ncbi:MAG: quaternary ammonium compound efflux SMR transporter SugE [Desulfobulbus sp.]|nr:quaternary ammonium compound efflux SMR transporter SugE [Desulfobulbus sp.]
MDWFLLIIAGLLEILWAIGLKYTHGFSRFWPSAITVSAMILSVVLLGVAMKTIPVGTAYAVWVGVGLVGTVLLGILLFNEPIHWTRLLSLTCVLAGIVGLKLTTPL